MMTSTENWLPASFVHPLRVDFSESIYLRPIRASDVDIDLIAVHANRDMLWEQYGEAWGWPPVDMTLDEDLADLARHAEEIERHESFNYAILSGAEGGPDQRLLGCVYIDPPQSDEPGARPEVSWWCVADAPPALSAGLGDFVRSWIADEWPLSAPAFPFNG
ncbi:GNAT family N-acetyltransferase [Rarobacter faecitabidus]|nr:GNAT family N-acetyltransferase [Rarobacter faecitabidus]